MWTFTQRIKNLRFTCETIIFYEKTKIGHQKFWQMIENLPAGYLKSKKFPTKGVIFRTACGRPQKEGVRLMRTHVDKGRGQNPMFVWTS